MLAFLAPAYVELAPHSRWEPAILLAALAAIAVIGYFGAVALRAATTAFDGAFVAALVALVFLGPVPAVCIWIVSELGAFVAERRRLDAFLANAASFASASLAGGAVLATVAGSAPVGGSLGLADAGAIALAGVAMLAVNFFVGGFLISHMRGHPLSDVVRSELLGLLPATLAMVVAGTVAALLYSAIGVLALGLFSFVVMVPQMLLPRLLQPRPVHDLEHVDAVALYAQAIGRALGLTRQERLVLKDAAPYMRERQLRPREGDLSNFSDEHRVALVEAVLFHREHWDSPDGFPGAVGGEMIPLLSRVLAVADAWAGLTAMESPRLDHRQALNQLEARAGLHFDPRVVAAAAAVVASEAFEIGTGVAYQPTAHRAPATRRALRLGARLVGTTA